MKNNLKTWTARISIGILVAIPLWAARQEKSAICGPYTKSANAKVAATKAELPG